MLPENLIRVGTLLKAHGIDGTMILKVQEGHETKLLKGDFLFVSRDQTKIPFFISQIEIAGDLAYIKLESIDSKTDTVRLTGCDVYLVSGKPGQLDDDFQDFAGFIFRDITSGREGLVVGVSDLGDNLVFNVISDNREYLLPLNRELIQSVNANKKRIVFNMPEGIFDINV